MNTIALRLAPDIREKLEVLASATGVSPSALVALAVTEYVERELGQIVEAHRLEHETGNTESRIPSSRHLLSGKKV